MLRKGRSADTQNQIADLKLRCAKQIALGFADQKSSQTRNLLIDSKANLAFEQLRFAFLFLVELLPGHGVSFHAISPRSEKSSPLYKNSTNFSAAHTERGQMEINYRLKLADVIAFLDYLERHPGGAERKRRKG